MNQGLQGFIVAGTHSGVGKTTVSLALLSLLSESGYRVQPFKIGPDFIDPAYHELATGRASLNLDLWMMGLAEVRATLERYARSAEVTVIEAMGALHDGEDGTRRGSAAYFAHHLGLPVLLVVDIWGMTRSTAAVIRGFEELDPRVEIAAVVLNRAGSRGHFEMVQRALPPSLRRRVAGYLPADDRLTVPERHLGLLTPQENPEAAELRQAISCQAKETLEAESLVRLLGLEHRPVEKPEPATAAKRPPVRIGVARDRAFCFYYRENLRLLEEAGAELVPFSPIDDPHLPARLDGLYFGGGYPESFAAELSANGGLRREVRELAARGLAIYGECGGMLYLGESLVGFDDRRHPMARVLPVEVAMDHHYLAIKYVEIETTRETVLGPRGTRARGQEFHQSRILSSAVGGDCFRLRDSTGNRSAAGFAVNQALASYVHLHFASNKEIPRNFVAQCHRHRTNFGHHLAADSHRLRTAQCSRRPNAGKHLHLEATRRNP